MQGYSEYNVNQLLKFVVAQLVGVREGTNFKVKDLFMSVYWDQIEEGTRRNLGRRVMQECQNGGCLAGIIEPVRKSTANQQYYVKLGSNAEFIVPFFKTR